MFVLYQCFYSISGKCQKVDEEPPLPPPLSPPPTDVPERVTCHDCSTPLNGDNSSALPGWCRDCFVKNVQRNQEIVANTESSACEQQKPTKQLDLPDIDWKKRQRESEQVWFARIQAGFFFTTEPKSFEHFL
jgi:hypothetical protein